MTRLRIASLRPNQLNEHSKKNSWTVYTVNWNRTTILWVLYSVHCLWKTYNVRFICTNISYIFVQVYTVLSIKCIKMQILKNIFKCVFSGESIKGKAIVVETILYFINYGEKKTKIKMLKLYKVCILVCFLVSIFVTYHNFF